MLLTHISTLNNFKTDTSSRNTILITQTDDKTFTPSIVQKYGHSDRRVDRDGKPSCVMIAMEEQSQDTDRTEETDSSK